MPAKRAAVDIGKGGVGKTTTIAHIAAHAENAIAIDLSAKQNDLATHFDINVSDPDVPLSAVFSDKWDIITDSIDNVVDRMVYETEEGVDIIPSDPGLSGADNNLGSVPVEKRYLKMDNFVDEYLAEQYDVVLFDLAGKEDNITLNGVVAATNLISPACPGQFEQNQLKQEVLDTDEFRDDYGKVLDEHSIPHPQLRMVIPTMIDKRENESQRFLGYLNETFESFVTEPIVNSANVGTAQKVGCTLYAMDDDELYNTGKQAKETYRNIANELLSTIEPR